MHPSAPSPTRAHRLPAVAAALALLAIPAVAMLFTEEVDWRTSDFVIMGALLTITALAGELAWRKAGTRARRLLYLGAVLLVAFLIYAELAVGVFGTPFAGS